MTDKDELNLEQLLNAYIDGELSDRQCTEVKRLASHDKDVAEQINELQRYKALLGSLPREDAPAGLIDDIKASLERKVLLSAYGQRQESRTGARNLVMRKLVTVAAMLFLVAVLGFVVFNVIGPQIRPHSPLIGNVPPAKQPLPAMQTPAITPAADKNIAKTFDEGLAGDIYTIKLTLKTRQPVTANQIIGRAIYDNDLLDYTAINRQPAKSTYSLNCERAVFINMLTDIRGIWDKTTAKTLVVDRSGLNPEIVVDDITPSQIEAILKQDNITARAELAKEIAVINNVEKSVPSKQVFAQFEVEEHSLLAPSKPVLTSGKFDTSKPAQPAQSGEKINAIITITGN